MKLKNTLTNCWLRADTLLVMPGKHGTKKIKRVPKGSYFITLRDPGEKTTADDQREEMYTGSNADHSR